MKIKVRFRVMECQNGSVKIVPIQDETMIPRPCGDIEHIALITEIKDTELTIERNWDIKHETK